MTKQNNRSPHANPPIRGWQLALATLSLGLTIANNQAMNLAQVMTPLPPLTSPAKAAPSGNPPQEKTQEKTAAQTDPEALPPPGLFPVDATWEGWDADTRRRLDDAVRLGYDAISPEGSSDQVLIRQSIRDAFLAECRRAWSQSFPDSEPPAVDSAVFVWRLLNQRKAGKLPPATGRSAMPPIEDQHRLIAEIASRRAEDEFRQSLDRILVDDLGRQRFAENVSQLSPTEDLDTIRRAALALRKARQLRPELSARLVNWPIEHRTLFLPDLVADSSSLPEQPGVYLFRDETGYLYIGEAKNLRARLRTHLEGSDRAALAQYLERPSLDVIYVDLHVFPSDSPGETLAVRRAYESELIRSRQPRFNLRP